MNTRNYLTDEEIFRIFDGVLYELFDNVIYCSEGNREDRLDRMARVLSRVLDYGIDPGDVRSMIEDFYDADVRVCDNARYIFKEVLRLEKETAKDKLGYLARLEDAVK